MPRGRLTGRKIKEVAGMSSATDRVIHHEGERRSR
jgi:hypothetical protein